MLKLIVEYAMFACTAIVGTSINATLTIYNAEFAVSPLLEG